MPIEIESKSLPVGAASTTTTIRRIVSITAVEDDDRISDILVDTTARSKNETDDEFIPGPSASKVALPVGSELDISKTEHHVKGDGILASRSDLNLPAEEFAAGCILLQAAACGDRVRMDQLLKIRPNHINFRDYDRRTALHVAASEGHLMICQYLVEEKSARINRSDRWGGSPLDDAHRHRHHEVVQYLRERGALTGNGNQAVNLITAAAEGDYDEVRTLLSCWGNSSNAVDAAAAVSVATKSDSKPTNDKSSIFDLVNHGDYDNRTALHLAAMEGHPLIVKILCEHSANVNAKDRWGNTPLDDALRANNLKCAQTLQKFGGKKGSKESFATEDLSQSQRVRENDNLKVAFDELEIIDRIGSGAFGEIFKCKWRGILVAAKCIKSTKITQQWVKKNTLEQVKRKCSTTNAAKGSNNITKDNANQGSNDADDIDDAIELLDQLQQETAAKKLQKVHSENICKNEDKCESSNQSSNKDKTKKEETFEEEMQTSNDTNERELALADFRQEISVLKSLRHPNIVLLLAYSTTEDYEVMISELMKCSLLDILKAHLVHGTYLKKNDAVRYATHLAQGMHYLHTCKPPIIHRDLKPANLLIDHAGILKISDFGLAKVRPNRTKKDSDVFNMTGETGSYRFMAPEVYRHQKYDETVDIYSYAMILFYLLHGKPPFYNYNGLKAVKKAAEEGDRPVIPRSWHQILQSILTECWDDNPRARPPFHQIVKRLEEYSRQEYGRGTKVRGHRDSQKVVSKAECCIIL